MLQVRQKRSKAARVHAFGVALGLWPHVLHRPRQLTTGRLLSCAIYRAAFYGGVVRELETAAEGIKEEMHALLQRVADGDASEAGQWYTNQEGIASRPLEWIQRHVGCHRVIANSTFEVMPPETRRICTAAIRATEWYYGRGDEPGGPDDPASKYFGTAMISLLGPRQHVRPHTGPTNERIAFSLGLDGELEGSELRVGTARRRWAPGKALVFDDALEHQVRVPNGTRPRAVLIMHVLHPQLMPTGSNGRLLAERMLDPKEESACEEGDYGFVDWEATEDLSNPSEAEEEASRILAGK